MVKKTVILAMIVVMLAGAFSGCGNINKQAEATSMESGEFPKELVITASKATDTITEKFEDLQAKMLKEKFNIVLNWQNYSGNDWTTKMDLLFASHQEPEYFNYVRQDQRGTEWAAAGYLKAFTSEDFREKLPNYIKSWTKEGWEEAYSNMKAADGNIYYLPSQRPDEVAQAWIYRKDIFDELGLTFPKTTDELYNVMKTYKEKTGKVAIPNGGNDLWAINWAFMPFGIPELVLRDLSCVDPLTNEFIPYVMADSKKVRPMLIYLNKLYREGLLWKESFTATKLQTAALQSKGEGMMLWGYPASIAAYNSTYKDVAPKVDWQWAKDMITAYPSKGTAFKKEPSYKAWGPALSSNISDEKRERLIKFLDWASTEEGKKFFNFGVEGVTYEVKDGQPAFFFKMQTPDNPKGQVLTQYGIQDQFLFILKLRNDKYNGGMVNTEVYNEFLNKKGYYSFLNAPLTYTEEESKKLIDPQTRVNDVRNDYLVKFIMGNLDPNNDKDWNSYMEALNKAGLSEVVKIRTVAYNRSIGSR
jgi:putative aldouronate transport system substrate-binding protein